MANPIGTGKLNRSWNLTEVGQYFGVGRARVGQIRNKAIAKLIKYRNESVE